MEDGADRQCKNPKCGKLFTPNRNINPTSGYHGNFCSPECSREVFVFFRNEAKRRQKMLREMKQGGYL